MRTATTLASVPLFAAADFYSRRLFNDMFFRRYQGESEDRLRYLADELFDNVIRPSIFPGAYELIDKSKRLGLRQVLVTGALDLTVLPLARHLGIDDWVTNRLEYVDGKATGRLLPPDHGGRHQGQLDAGLRRARGAATSRTATATRTA